MSTSRRLDLLVVASPAFKDALVQATEARKSGLTFIESAPTQGHEEENANYQELISKPGVYGFFVDTLSGDAPLVYRFQLPTTADNFDELATAVVTEVNALLSRDWSFISTRGERYQKQSSSERGSAKAKLDYRYLDVIREGLANDGGLFMPRQIPTIPRPVLDTLLFSSEMTYIEMAQSILERLVDFEQLPFEVLRSFLNNAYAADRWRSSNGVVCPVVPLGADNNQYLLELFHGPTAAFKDFALQLFPYMFQRSISKEAHKYLILAATSGDTGVAVIEGVRLSKAPGLKVMVLYPENGVSPVQKIQMVAADGDSVRVIGCKSDFDFCQSTVKTIFNDEATNTQLEKDSSVKLSSANSINWGRLVPQIVYYFFGYQQLVKKGAIKKSGDLVDIAVPTGNFGNILSAYIARKMGLPVRRFVLASNENDVLYDFVRTGVYDISKRTLLPTDSPSIDILRASNIERLLYILSDGDTTFVSKMMAGLNDPATKKFEVTEEMKKELQSSFWSMRCDGATCSKQVGSTFASTSATREEGSIVLDPHTAVAVHAVDTYQAEIKSAGIESVPILIASTAQWAKFPIAVCSALNVELPAGLSQQAASSSSVSPAEKVMKSVTDMKELYGVIDKEVQAKSVKPAVQFAPAIPLSAMLDKLSSASSTNLNVRSSDAEVPLVVKELHAFAGQQ